MEWERDFEHCSFDDCILRFWPTQKESCFLNFNFQNDDFTKKKWIIGDAMNHTLNDEHPIKVITWIWVESPFSSRLFVFQCPFSSGIFQLAMLLIFSAEGNFLKLTTGNLRNKTSVLKKMMISWKMNKYNRSKRVTMTSKWREVSRASWACKVEKQSH